MNTTHNGVLPRKKAFSEGMCCHFLRILCLLPYTERDFKRYLPRDHERMGVWLFSFLLPKPLTQEKDYDIYYNCFF